MSNSTIPESALTIMDTADQSPQKDEIMLFFNALTQAAAGGLEGIDYIDIELIKVRAYPKK
jgi:hypothetical protein